MERIIPKEFMLPLLRPEEETLPIDDGGIRSIEFPIRCVGFPSENYRINLALSFGDKDTDSTQDALFLTEKGTSIISERSARERDLPSLSILLDSNNNDDKGTLIADLINNEDTVTASVLLLRTLSEESPNANPEFCSAFWKSPGHLTRTFKDLFIDFSDENREVAENVRIRLKIGGGEVN